MKIFDITFLKISYFLLLLFLPIFWYFFYKNKKNSINFSSFSDLKKVFKRNSASFYLRFFLLNLIFIVFVLILADPNLENVSEKQKNNGIDIVFAFDISESMNAVDLAPTRLEAAKKVMSDFLEVGSTNRIGLVIFAGKPFVGIPLTFDYNAISTNLSDISTKNINQNILGGTAVGDAILMAKNMFDLEEKEREKIIILLTDGEANTGVDPKIAATSAKEENIKIYTIGIGDEKPSYMIYNNGFYDQKYEIAPLNSASLEEISKLTEAKFFRATDNKTLQNIFEELEKFQKTEIEYEIKQNFLPKYDFLAYLLSFLIFILILNMINFRFFNKI